MKVKSESEVVQLCPTLSNLMDCSLRGSSIHGIFQAKEQDKNQEKQLHEMEIGKLPEKEFRIMKMKVTQDFRKRMEKMQEMFTKDLEELKNKEK